MSERRENIKYADKLIVGAFASNYRLIKFNNEDVSHLSFQTVTVLVVHLQLQLDNSDRLILESIFNKNGNCIQTSEQESRRMKARMPFYVANSP